jgi:predicted amino acid-binding ACT domain protein
MAFDVDGRMTGSDNNGCVYSGSVAIGSAAINIYQISLTVESCSIADRNILDLS